MQRLIFIFVAIFLVFILIEFCGSNSSKITALKRTQDSIINVFKKKYDFDVDSLGNALGDVNLDVVKPDVNSVRKSIIFYGIIQDSVEFHYQLNKELPNDVKSLKLKEIKTAVILKNLKEQLGYYNNGKTIAYRINTQISFIDIVSHKVITNRILKGGIPPTDIRYLHSSPEYQYGPPPSKQDIEFCIREIITQ